MRVRIWAIVIACCFFAASCSDPQAGVRASDEDAFRKFVATLPAGGSAIGPTIIGKQSGSLIASVKAIGEGGVISAALDRISPVSESTYEGRIRLRFADEAVLEVLARVEIDRGRVVAAPAALSTQLLRWEALRIETFGSPERGDILSRQGTLLAQGPKRERQIAHPDLGPAIELIDDSLDVRLAGKLGRRLLAGERAIAETTTLNGEDLRTSLDDEVQTAGESALGRYSGALVAVDPRTGGIRAFVSKPQQGLPDRSPATFPSAPGSTFKIVTAAAALDGSIYKMNDVIPCPRRITIAGRVIRNFRDLDYGSITVEKAFAVSCNTAFAQIGMEVGLDRLLQTGHRLGFSVGDTSGAAAISVPRSPGDLAFLSFGGEGIVVSPLHMAEVASTVARGGTRIQVGWADGHSPGQRVFKKSTASALTSMMEEVVATGGGRSATVESARIGGKTGTADHESSSDAWFVATAPSRSTRLVVVVFLPGGGVGGESAAPVAHDFLEATKPAWAS